MPLKKQKSKQKERNANAPGIKENALGKSTNASIVNRVDDYFSAIPQSQSSPGSLAVCFVYI